MVFASVLGRLRVVEEALYCPEKLTYEEPQEHSIPYFDNRSLPLDRSGSNR